MNDIWQLPKLNASEKITLLAIADESINGIAEISYNTLTKKTGLSRSALSKQLKILTDVNLITGKGERELSYTISIHRQLDNIGEIRKQYSRNNLIPKVMTETEISAKKIAFYLAKKIKEHINTSNLSPESWESDIDKALRIDNRTEDELLSIIDWIYSPTGSFWRANILSGKKLRMKYDQMCMQSQGSRKNRVLDNTSWMNQPIHNL